MMTSNNSNIENLLYESGITAQGCWDTFDEYDKKAIMRLIHLTIVECIIIANSKDPCQDGFIGQEIRDWFGL